MIKKILPLIFLLVGAAAGIGGGMFMFASQSKAVDGQHAENSKEKVKEATQKKGKESSHETASGTEFVKLHSQFVIPIIRRDEVSALVVMSLSIEAEPGVSETIFAREPKLRDLFLQALFEHSNMGGFDGAFTSAGALEPLRVALREVAIAELGEGVVNVLITDLARQDT